jgi:hypothetical protein
VVNNFDSRPLAQIRSELAQKCVQPESHGRTPPVRAMASTADACPSAWPPCSSHGPNSLDACPMPPAPSVVGARASPLLRSPLYLFLGFAWLPLARTRPLSPFPLCAELHGRHPTSSSVPFLSPSSATAPPSLTAALDAPFLWPLLPLQTAAAGDARAPSSASMASRPGVTAS